MQETEQDALGFQREASQQLCSQLCYFFTSVPSSVVGIEKAWGAQLCLTLEGGAQPSDRGAREQVASPLPACVWKKREGRPQPCLHWARDTYIQVLGSLFLELFAGRMEELVQDGVGPFAVQSQLTPRVSHWEQGKKGRSESAADGAQKKSQPEAPLPHLSSLPSSFFLQTTEPAQVACLKGPSPSALQTVV